MNCRGSHNANSLKCPKNPINLTTDNGQDSSRSTLANADGIGNSDVISLTASLEDIREFPHLPSPRPLPRINLSLKEKEERKRVTRKGEVKINLSTSQQEETQINLDERVGGLGCVVSTSSGLGNVHQEKEEKIDVILDILEQNERKEKEKTILLKNIEQAVKKMNDLLVNLLEKETREKESEPKNKEIGTDMETKNNEGESDKNKEIMSTKNDEMENCDDDDDDDDSENIGIMNLICDRLSDVDSLECIDKECKGIKGLPRSLTTRNVKNYLTEMNDSDKKSMLNMFKILEFITEVLEGRFGVKVHYDS